MATTANLTTVYQLKDFKTYTVQEIKERIKTYKEEYIRNVELWISCYNTLFEKALMDLLDKKDSEACLCKYFSLGITAFDVSEGTIAVDDEMWATDEIDNDFIPIAKYTGYIFETKTTSKDHEYFFKALANAGYMVYILNDGGQASTIYPFFKVE